jgi:hypothetical protein
MGSPSTTVVQSERLSDVKAGALLLLVFLLGILAGATVAGPAAQDQRRV